MVKKLVYWIWGGFMGILLFPSLLHAQETDYTKPRSKTFYTYQKDGKTYLAGRLDTIRISDGAPTARERKRGRRRLRKFTRLRYNVHKAYPYALKVSEILKEVEAEMATIEDDKKLKEYMKEKEKDLFGRYEKDIKKMSRSQGKILVKLIYRETGGSMFSLIKDNKSRVSAVFWQSVGLIFGINLKASYDPEEEDMIEFFVTDLEKGGYNIAFKRYNFTLD
ncbi:MAG: DUF4294 domain-containing protein [Bacteroidota bacterium]